MTEKSCDIARSRSSISEIAVSTITLDTTNPFDASWCTSPLASPHNSPGSRWASYCTGYRISA